MKSEHEKLEQHRKIQGVKPSLSKVFKQGMGYHKAKLNLKKALAKKMK